MPKRSKKKNVRPRYIPRRYLNFLPEYEDERIALLPWELVISYLEVRDIVAVSLCSKNMSNLMTLNQSQSTLDCDIDVHVQNGKMSVEVENYDNKEDKVIFNFGHVSKESSKTLLHANGGRMLAVKCQPDQFKGVFDIWCLDSKCDYTMRAVIKHLTTLFGIDVNNFYINFTGKNQNFQFRRLCPRDFTVQNMKFEGESHNGDIPFLISNVKVTESFIDKKERNIGFVPAGKLACSSLIDCGNATWMNPEMFYSLNCHKAVLRRTRLTWLDIAEFVRRWKAAPFSDKDNLVYMRCEVHDSNDKQCLETLLGRPVLACCRYSASPQEFWSTKDQYDFLLTLTITGNCHVSFRVTEPTDDE
ncbi:hypothetical protein CAEBREN_04486 [Caenorhabditis brenneri]|uniref:F-box domain-containing protein n=1 Tax=Caenorhabditis brenneri TaxID=135651 RepID=G0MB15_CAEBE|nr:hypothetical protein CAEBREN_04486 [Caenorhabditis brenneri]